ncbi:TadE-like protein [Murinocardiopsis flavida]|uniref:TadE-like protein n=1 Tax=Murinocardiopsis flavida TaxID=645275 RepID=A0A2P8CY89_9ACTN|nr:TadE/TadG family type IV pilus assembly protein [Murinocardiopsis flavida]PSK89940.1 TadE-like protein [Murinocardiopsis flavida]
MASCRSRRRDDRGSTELAIATPLLLLLVMLVVQTALWAHAGHVAETIAHHGLAAARAVDTTETEGNTTAEQVADQLAGDLVTDLDITVERSATTARITVTARVPSVIPGMSWPVAHDKSAPVERIAGVP